VRRTDQDPGPRGESPARGVLGLTRMGDRTLEGRIITGSAAKRFCPDRLRDVRRHQAGAAFDGHRSRPRAET